MSRVWSLRTRTALAFAVTSMALTAAAIVFVTLGSQHAIAEVVVADASGGVAISPDASGGPRRATGPAPDGAAAPGGIAIVSRVAALQWQWSALGIAGAGVVAGLTGWLLSRRMLAPLDRIAGTAERISASTLHERIDLRGPDDELRRLSRTIDGLLDRLETAFASQRRFVAQASHELRTPIAVQRAAIQIGLHDDADAVDVARARAELLEQNRRTEHLVESLLVLAEAERGLDGRTADVDLGVLAGAVVDEAQAAAREAGVRLCCTVLGVGAVRCEPVLTRQLVHNLVDNAIEYNVPGGHVDVEVDRTVLRIRNTGPELDVALVPTLTEPFRRASAAAGGRRHSGLGLSIVEAVAQAHGWRVSLAARPGGGLVAEVDVSPM
ncbi:HAMP domain-containing sensor histidine kinase [Curtobacterium sp. CFBP9011]|uniref:sensor histidine kinase n=1 Tax=Curtobacterium sp. CFBP9011 TaxID=3096530 RepID=UPI002A6B0F1C|nr:HAMP domain-containing sensor histidine kinase [Curtobacterium sp. CFBP9011]MDY1005470.1 HAMP domain-containing sensor histidine kinase [Curtobacterium sp. CFBP9011]